MASITVFTDSAPNLPCNWTVTVDCDPDWDTYDPGLQEAAAQYGALLMWTLTGRRFGACRRTVRPCHRSYENQADAGWWWADGVWFPYILNGVWRNCAGCSGAGWGCCTCEPRCQIYLTPPVSGIVEVRFSGDVGVIDPSSYRVDNYQWLVRQDGECWPTCNDYNKPVTGDLAPDDDSAWEVTYLWGSPVPAVLSRAAGELASEWAKSCLGKPCALPQRVQSISRQGINVTMVSVDELLDRGLTGLTTVDNLIRAFNPYGMTSRMKIASPDLPVIRRTTSP